MRTLASRELTGDPRQVGAVVDRLVAAGLLVSVGSPKPHRDGCSVVVVVRRTADVAPTRPQLPAPSRSGWDRRALTTQQLRAARVAGLSAALGGGLVFLVWLLGRAAAGAKAWAGANPTVVVLCAVIAGICGLLWLNRRFGRKSGGGGGCPGMVHHCNGCRDHR